MFRQPFNYARRCAGWEGWRRPAARLALASAAILTVLAGVAAVGGFVVPALAAQGAGTRHQPSASGPRRDVPGRGGDPGATLPTASPSPGATASPGPDTGPVTLTAWAKSLDRLGIPGAALQAYGYAELTTTQVTPSCHLTWTTLAGIGKIESNHGTHGTSSLDANGVAHPPIYGPALDGTHDNKLIPDSDNGRLDGDTTYDRAVGPMQFLPGTWTRWGTDADGDGDANPQDIDDAALSAARYLCANGHDLATGAGWWQAIHSYNNLDKYASDVYAAADAYGVASRG